MHHKFALFDQRVLLTGSYNWTRAAARDNQENIVITGDPVLVDAFTNTFEDLWRRFAQ
jgi:cardiolipin hydrolase